MKNKFGLRWVLCVLLCFAAVAVFNACDDDGSSIGTAACGNTILRTIPADTSVQGPWSVGSRTVEVEGLTTEVWYPAVPGSEAGKSKDWIDTKDYLPDSNPDPNDPKFQIDSYEGLPLDTAYGPYPVIVFVHGTGSFRTASHKLFTHWASRGFIVICADNTGINLGDMMAGKNLGKINQAGETKKILSVVRSESDELSFLAGHMATDRIGLAGHSAGGMAVSGLGDEQGVKVIITMASGGIQAGTNIESAMIMGGMEDGAAREPIVRRGYRNTNLKKRLVLIPDAGHNVFLSTCDMKVESSVSLGLLEGIANDGCGPQYMDPELSTPIVQFASTAAFEETLMCSTTAAAQIDTIESKYPGVDYEYDENPGTGGCR